MSSPYKVLTTLAEYIDRESPLTLSLVFCRVASAGKSGIFQGSVQTELGLTAASMTRAVQTLSDLHYTKNKPGLDLISRHMDFASDGRQHVLKLTAKGAQLSKELSDSTKRASAV